jgi:hypothetical protein
MTGQTLALPGCTLFFFFFFESYPDPSPRRYAGSNYRYLYLHLRTVNHYIPTNLEPRQGLWWPKCLLFCSAASLARGFETSQMPPQSPVQHLGCSRHARPRLAYLPYLVFPLPAYLRYC